MWFSHVSSPLGPRVRTTYKFILDFINDEDLTKLSKLSNIFVLKCFDVNLVDDAMTLSYIDPDIIDVIKSSACAKKKVIIASYY
ncbi:MAG: hypothetical protein QXO72_01875 [Sulfolobales archaeon]